MRLTVTKHITKTFEVKNIHYPEEEILLKFPKAKVQDITWTAHSERSDVLY